MKKLILLLTCCCLAAPGFAQNALPYLYGSHFNQQTARFHPSLLGDTPYTGQVGIVNAYAYVGTNAVTYNDIKAAGIDKNLTNAQVDAIVSNLKTTNQFSSGLYVGLPFVNFAFKVQKEDETGRKREKFSMAVFSNVRVESSLTFSKVLAEFLWKGNKQFVGQSVDVGKVSVNGFSQAEAGIGLAIPFKISDKLVIRGGVRLKYIAGFGSIYTEKASGVLTTTDNGINSEVRADLNYKVNVAFPSSSNNDNIGIIGRGFGADLGATAVFDSRFAATLSLIDIGAVHYKPDANTDSKSYSLSGTTSFKGIDLNNSASGQSNLLDSLANQFVSKEAVSAFNAPLPTRLILQGEYRILKENKKGQIYNRHTFYLTYFQGIRNLGSATTSPALSAGYSLNLGKVFNVGTSIGVGGQNKLSVGMFTSVRLAALTIGFGSGNALFLLSPQTTAGADATVNFGLNF